MAPRALTRRGLSKTGCALSVGLLALSSTARALADPSPPPAYRIIDLGTLGYASGINDKGQVVGTALVRPGQRDAVIDDGTGIHDLGDDVVRKINKAVLVPDDEARIGNGERSYAINRKRPRMPGPSIAFAS